MTRVGRARLVAGMLGLALLGWAIQPSVAAPSLGQADGARSTHQALSVAPAAQQLGAGPTLPLGDSATFAGRVLVAYYGTAQTVSMGVLGEGTIPAMTRRLRAAARPFAARGRQVQIVYELIVTVADGHPGPDGDYSHFIPRADVERFVRAARRNNALLVLDLQPGRTTFLAQARQFRWALRRPFVGLALDPEWRVGPRQVPGRTIGSVTAREVNAVSAMVARLTRDAGLPEKVFVLHQFRTDMVQNIEGVRARSDLAMVQHVDGFGSRRAKLATYHHVARPAQFAMGFKLFYDEDTNLFTPRQVLGIRPRVRFVSYQ